ncbi:MAG: Cytochrome c biogenesis protein Ccs1 [Chlamydiae bacterium]|nr:Cytochrome c biogenesis protein Ccs1 [Chlamydiota bacterium]
MMNFNKFLRWLSSPKLTIACLSGVMILVFFGTLEQVQSGIHFAQEKYFRSLFVYGQINGFPVKIPYFPGGYLFAGALLLNLISAYAVYFRFSRKKIGILLIHLGIVLLIVGEVLTGFFSVESQMVVGVGGSSNFSESLREMELVVIEKSASEFDQVVTIPGRVLRSGKALHLSSLPFSLHFKKVYANARLLGGDGKKSPHQVADRGLGAEIQVIPLPQNNRDDEINNLTTFVEIKEGDNSLGTWLLARAITTPQPFHLNGKDYELFIRRTRYYYPFSIQLDNFVREMYTGADIPKSFSSHVRLFREDGELERQSIISMNNPLRFGGKAFYQASYAENDTISVLQVVDNPGKILPYLSSGLVGVGLLIQFLMSIYRFEKKKKL